MTIRGIAKLQRAIEAEKSAGAAAVADYVRQAREASGLRWSSDMGPGRSWYPSIKCDDVPGLLGHWSPEDAEGCCIRLAYGHRADGRLDQLYVSVKRRTVAEAWSALAAALARLGVEVPHAD